MRSLQIIALITNLCTHYKSMYTVQIYILITKLCTYYKYMYSLQIYERPVNNDFFFYLLLLHVLKNIFK